jgi:branched-chain amino acid transport system substrate-binding protein
MRRLFLLAFAGALACSRSSEPIHIGVAGPWKEEFGRMNKQGIDLAVAHINARGGVRGRPLRLIERDDEGTGSMRTAASSASSVM